MAVFGDRGAYGVPRCRVCGAPLQRSIAIERLDPLIHSLEVALRAADQDHDRLPDPRVSHALHDLQAALGT